MKNETGFFEGRENRKLFYQKWLPEGEGNAKTYIVALHGWGTHSDRMKTPAEYLTSKGYAIYSFDLRGHWRNAGDYPGHIDSMDHIQKDIVLFMDVVKKDSGNKKIFLMGHAFGGLIGLIYAINRPNLPGVIVSSPELGLAFKKSGGQKFSKKISESFAKIAPTYKTLEMIINQNQLTSDLKILREHLADKNKLEFISFISYSEIYSSIK